MKRFWKFADTVEAAGGHAITLDGRPVKTPARAELRVPTRTLADAIAAEWNESGETIDPGAMPLTGLANAAIDRISPDKEALLPASPATARATSPAIGRKARSCWFDGRRKAGTRCSNGRGGATTWTSIARPA